MAYIDTAYYKSEFQGTPIPDSQFSRLESIASDLIDSVVSAPIIVADLGADSLALLKKACAYQVEHLFNLGGIDAISGMSELDMGSEHLGSYSVSNAHGSSSSTSEHLTVDGIPFSAMTKALLKRAGLMSRWVYKGTRLDNG